MTTQTSRSVCRWSFALALFGLASIAQPVHAQGIAERAGGILDNAGRSIRRGVENVVARSQAMVQEQDVYSRVYSRIHWDKHMAGSLVQIEVREDGTVVLRGAVTNAAAKKRAAILARDTVGVTAIVDELAIADAPKVITPGEPVIEEPLAPGTTTRVVPRVVKPAPPVVSEPATTTPAPATPPSTTTTIEP